jgi:hypothetical protein
VACSTPPYNGIIIAFTIGIKALPKILLALIAAVALSFAHHASANLITNGGFETGDFTGWTVTGCCDTFVGGSVGGGPSPHSGNFQAVPNPSPEPVSLAQTSRPRRAQLTPLTSGWPRYGKSLLYPSSGAARRFSAICFRRGIPVTQKSRLT